MTPRLGRGLLLLLSVLLVVGLTAGAARATPTYIVDTETWTYPGTDLTVQVTEEYWSWEYAQTHRSDLYAGPGINIFEWTVNPLGATIETSFWIDNPTGAAVTSAWNDSGWTNPAAGTTNLTWLQGTGMALNNWTGTFRLWTTGKEGTTTGHGFVYDEANPTISGVIMGPTTGPVVPEPSSVALLALGAVGLLSFARRRR